MQALSSPAEADISRPFNALLLEDEQQRADALLALFVRLAAADLRVIRMGGGTRRSPGTLEHILTEAAGPGDEAFSGDNARLIVRAIAKQQGHEQGVMLLIKQAETVHPKMLRALQAMAPYFVQDGEPTLQVTFVGRPTFLALLDEPGLTPLRQALGFLERPQALEPKAADTFVEPTGAARPRVPFPKSSGANDLPELAEAARVLDAAQPSKAPPGVSGRPAQPSLTTPLKVVGSSRLSDGMGRREPTFAQQYAPVVEPGVAEPAVAAVRVRRRRRVPLRLILMLVAVVVAAEAAYSGLHLVFYRDVPARSVVSMASPAAPPPVLPSPPPVPSIPAPPTPPPPVAAAPAPAPSVAPHVTATPSTPSAAPPSAEPSAQLRQDFDAFLASSGRNVAALSEAQRDSLFTEYLEWRAQNAVASKALNATPGRRIVIHIPAGSEAAETLSAHLLESLPSKSGTVEARRVATTPDRPSIRYFHPEDEPAARLTAKWMADTGLNWTLQDFSTFHPLPSRGTIEVWLPKQP